MREPRYLFVYGTLMNGMSASQLLAGMRARFVARASINGQLYDLGEYPAVVKSRAPSDVVSGELYEIGDPDVISTLDQYEGYRPGRHSSLFVRDVATAKRSDTGRKSTAWVYFYNPRRSLGQARRIETGDYRRRLAT